MGQWTIRLAAGILLAGSALIAKADPAAVAPPPGATLRLGLGADGIQFYLCESTDKGPAWVFKSPEATLFDPTGRQVGTHFAGPSWKLADGSTVVGEVIGKDTPDATAIPWLLLRAKSHEGTGALAGIGFIRRIDTKGGLAPANGCDASHLGEPALMRYSAQYEFYEAGK